MKKAVNALSSIGLLALLMALPLLSIFWRLSSPDMTETRLLITHWREYILLIVLGVGFLVSYRMSE
jgi:hypothetical protein